MCKKKINTDYIMCYKQYFTMEEVQLHANEESMWVVANECVYDVTEFWKRHPGGKFLVKSKAGTDVSKHKQMHSDRAKQIWNKYLIGYIKTTKCL